jgi:hypothetical protein
MIARWPGRALSFDPHLSALIRGSFSQIRNSEILTPFLVAV